MRPFCVYRDVLGAEANAALFDTVLRERSHFEQSRVVPRRVDPSRRVSTVVYDDRLAAVAPLVRGAVEERLDDALPRLRLGRFVPAAFEIQLTSHNDGEFFGRHRDAASRDTATRSLSFVYYVHREPRAFSGGELVLYDGDEAVVVEPVNDALVLFDPRTPHEVRPVSCPSGRFEDGRFTLNGWVHRHRAAASVYPFDKRIFTPVGRWGASPDRWSTSRCDRIDVRSDISAREFFAEYFRPHRPVLIPGLLADSAAVATWSPRAFAQRFPGEPVEITADRERTPDYEVRFRDTVVTTTMDAFVDGVLAAGESNDVYLVARNHFFDRPAFRPLLDDLRPPPDIVDLGSGRHGAVKLWFGPAGTVTPVHFDEHSILFAQIYGRKQFKLVPWFDTPHMRVRDRYYSEVDIRDVTRATVLDVEVGPGDALFLPARWWHWARATSVSMSVTFSAFATP